MFKKQEHTNPTLTNLLREKGSSLFAMSNLEFIRLIQQVIPESLYLHDEANVSVESYATLDAATKVYFLIKPEEIRAFAGLWLFKEVMNGSKEDYDSFVACQIEMKKPVLSFESFQAIRKYITETLTTPEDYAAAMWSILCNDLGKVHSVIEAYEKLPNAKHIGHDAVLAELLKARPELFPGFMSLTPEHQQHIISGYASGCDIAMYEQFELPMVSLNALKKLEPQALRAYILHTVFDVAGAAAHFKPNGSMTLHQETWDFFEATRKSLEKLQSNQPNSIEEAYNNYLQYRGQRIGIENNSPEAAALIRIAGLSRLATPAQGQMLLSVWQNLPESTKTILVNELNVHGSEGLRAIFIGYGVAMLLNSQGALQKELSEAAKINGTTVSPEQRAAANKEGLSIGLITMAKVFAKTRALIGAGEDQGKIFVAECDEIAKSLNKNPRAVLAMDLAVVNSSDRRIDFRLVERPAEQKDLQKADSVSTNQKAQDKSCDLTKLSQYPNIMFKPVTSPAATGANLEVSRISTL